MHFTSLSGSLKGINKFQTLPRQKPSSIPLQSPISNRTLSRPSSPILSLKFTHLNSPHRSISMASTSSAIAYTDSIPHTSLLNNSARPLSPLPLKKDTMRSKTRTLPLYISSTNTTSCINNSLFPTAYSHSKESSEVLEISNTCHNMSSSDSPSINDSNRY